MGLRVSPRVGEKLAQKHGVSVGEVLECFANRCGAALKDTRAEHRTDPPSLWFVAETDRGRTLKVVFMVMPDGEFEIKTAYPANPEEIRIYKKYGAR
jgi:uncharacterized DUF497 family protein